MKHVEERYMPIMETDGHQWLATRHGSYFPGLPRATMDKQFKTLPNWAKDNHMIGVARVKLTVEEIIS